VANDVTVFFGTDTISWYPMRRSSARLNRVYKKLKAETDLDVVPFDETNVPGLEYLTRGWICGQLVLKVIGCIRSV
jgi:hypothetical protein